VWFDATAALAEIQAGEKPGFDHAPGANRANRANPATQISTNSTISTPPALELQPDPETPQAPRGSNPEITPCASDAEAYLAVLLRDGPQTYGAMASILGWGGTRAWQTEARLRAAGLVRYGEFGKAQPTERNTHDRRP